MLHRVSKKHQVHSWQLLVVLTELLLQHIAQLRPVLDCEVRFVIASCIGAEIGEDQRRFVEALFATLNRSEVLLADLLKHAVIPALVLLRDESVTIHTVLLMNHKLN